MNIRTFSLAVAVFAACMLSTTSLPAQTQLELTQEAGNAYMKADVKMNETYEQAMRDLPLERQKLLREAQRAWLKYRDAAAKSAGSQYEGGSIQPMIELQAKTEMTEFRTKQIESLTQP